MYQLRWIPIPAMQAGSITMSQTEPFFLSGVEGLGNVPTSPETVRGPWQPGETLMGATVEGRTIALTLTAVADSRQQMWERRRELAKGFGSPVPRFGRQPELGVLEVYRDGQPVRTIEAIPVNSPEMQTQAGKVTDVDVELFCPDPYFRGEEKQVVLDTEDFDAGIEIPLEGIEITADGIEIPFDKVAAVAENGGDVSTAVTIEISGEIIDPRIINHLTGEEFRIVGLIRSGETVRIETGFGRKRVDFIDQGGNESPAFDRVDLSVSEFFRLGVGDNELELRFAEIVDGSATVTYRERFTGV